VERLSSFLRSPFSFLFASSKREERMAQYVIREHRDGRSLDDILADPYIKNRSTPQQTARLLDRPELIRALGEDMVAAAKQTLPAS
jgi:hypothetical protein